MKGKIIFLLRLIAAGILIQTLYFKFTGAPESKYIFSQLGAEPWGRYFSGVVELAASVLLLVPGTQIFGALISIGVMTGAVLGHIFVLGFVVQDDGGLLFSLACTVLISCLLIVSLQLDQVRRLISYGRYYLRSKTKPEEDRY